MLYWKNIKREMMKLAESMEEFSVSDFTVEELIDTYEFLVPV